LATPTSANSPLLSATSALLELPSDTVIDGEVVALDPAGKPAFKLLQGFGGESGRNRAYTFDVLMLRGKDVCSWPLEERRQCFREIAQQLPSAIDSQKDLMCLWPISSAWSGNAGSKESLPSARSPYRSGERCGDWLKCEVGPIIATAIDRS
jgi:ATP-dependent DNA ligase